MVFLRLWDPDGRVEIETDPPTMPTFPTSTKPFSSITLLSSPVLTSSSELLVPLFLHFFLALPQFFRRGQANLLLISILLPFKALNLLFCR
jgi:hypothetical protein